MMATYLPARIFHCPPLRAQGCTVYVHCTSPFLIIWFCLFALLLSLGATNGLVMCTCVLTIRDALISAINLCRRPQMCVRVSLAPFCVCVCECVWTRTRPLLSAINLNSHTLKRVKRALCSLDSHQHLPLEFSLLGLFVLINTFFAMKFVKLILRNFGPLHFCDIAPLRVVYWSDHSRTYVVWYMRIVMNRSHWWEQILFNLMDLASSIGTETVNVFPLFSNNLYRPWNCVCVCK